MPEIGVVHLVRAKNGIEPLKRFLNSYDKYPAGVAHDLILIFKGFSKITIPQPYEQLLQPYHYRVLFVRDFGYDIRPYIVAAKAFYRDYNYLLFINSFSEILDNDWLLKMQQNIAKEGVGLVGATGSYQSFYTDFIKGITTKSRFRLIIGGIVSTSYRFYFDPYPNYHIRTNAFMISSETMHSIRSYPIINKWEAWLFESGKNSLTKQILKMRKDILVVGKDGKGYQKDEWHKSNTFWQGDQDNLLIADNQTRIYTHGDNSTRCALNNHAWINKRKDQGDFSRIWSLRS